MNKIEDKILGIMCDHISNGKTVGIYQDGLSYIFVEPKIPEMREKVLKKLHRDENFQPMLAQVLEMDTLDIFDIIYMDQAKSSFWYQAPVRDSHLYTLTDEEEALTGNDQIFAYRSVYQAFTGIKNTAKVHIVLDHESYVYDLLMKYKAYTGHGVLACTEHEPDIVNLFKTTDLDFLYYNGELLQK